VPRWDFSTNANACGPAPTARHAVERADGTRYPDPSYTGLRERLGRFHGVPAQRIVLAASASEFITRMTAAVSRRWPTASVWSPVPAYADYARAAKAFGLRSVPLAGDASLVWHAEPGSPGGQSRRPPATREGAVLVVDAAYEPLRLEGDGLTAPTHAWRLMSPNKALGMTGVRAAYAIAPAGADALLLSLIDSLSPSWPVGAHGVALLESWTEAPTQAWLADSLQVLREWKRLQEDGCRTMGWTLEPSVTPFQLAHGPTVEDLSRLRTQGVKLRDAGPLGLEGAVRLSVQSPEAQRALRTAWEQTRP
jgi:histidinol-phosphate aminotransferase